MTKALFFALVAGAIILVALQSNGPGVTSAEVHTGDLHNCEDYATQADAQAHLRENPTDPDDIDHDGNGIACQTELDCPCDLTPVARPSTTATPTPTPTRTATPVATTGPSAPSGAGTCHAQCLPTAPQCNSLRDNDFLYDQCQNSLNSSPGYNRPVAMAFLVPNTTMPCGGQTNLVARLVYPDGVGAPNRFVTFQSSAGTVQSNLLTDFAGVVQTTYAAPLSPALVQIDAFADGLRQSLQLKVECAPPPAPLLIAPPAPAGPAPTSIFSPPKTGEAGLVSSDVQR